MTIEEDPKSINRTARLAGLLYVLSIPFSAFGYFYVPSALIVAGDPAATAARITAAEGLYRWGIVGWLIGQTLLVVVPLLLYRLLKTVNKLHAMLMVVFLLSSIPVAFMNEVNRLAALILLNGPGYLAAIPPGERQALAMFFLELHKQGIGVVQLFWGLWLFPFGFLVYKSGYLPRILGILLIIGCLGYVVDWGIFMLLPNSSLTVSTVLSLGEIVIAFWLLIKGADVEKWRQREMRTG